MQRSIKQPELARYGNLNRFRIRGLCPKIMFELCRSRKIFFEGDPQDAGNIKSDPASTCLGDGTTKMQRVSWRPPRLKREDHRCAPFWFSGRGIVEAVRQRCVQGGAWGFNGPSFCDRRL